jgi:hypothetical protein
MERKTCIAIIKYGPRRGQHCGRPCYNGGGYCEQYHTKFNQERLIAIGEPASASTEDQIYLEPRMQLLIRRERIVLPVEEELPSPVVIRPSGLIRAPALPSRSPTIAAVPAFQSHSPERVPFSRVKCDKTIKYLAGIRKPAWYERFCCSDISPARNITEDCSICTCRAVKDEAWVVTTCNHYFHAECMLSWVKTFKFSDNGCPLCRTPIVDNISDHFIVKS